MLLESRKCMVLEAVFTPPSNHGERCRDRVVFGICIVDSLSAGGRVAHTQYWSIVEMTCIALYANMYLHVLLRSRSLLCDTVEACAMVVDGAEHRAEGTVY